jgi:hypothetical protein
LLRIAARGCARDGHRGDSQIREFLCALKSADLRWVRRAFVVGEGPLDRGDWNIRVRKGIITKPNARSQNKAEQERVLCRATARGTRQNITGNRRAASNDKMSHPHSFYRRIDGLITRSRFE